MTVEQLTKLVLLQGEMLEAIQKVLEDRGRQMDAAMKTDGALINAVDKLDALVTAVNEQCTSELQQLRDRIATLEISHKE